MDNVAYGSGAFVGDWDRYANGGTPRFRDSTNRVACGVAECPTPQTRREQMVLAPSKNRGQ